MRAPEWAPFDIPGGNAAVQMALLDHDSVTRARTVLVRFPAGWTRGEAGSYVAAEDLVLLEGTLRMNGALWQAGDWAFVPARGLRAQMLTDDGALAYARFLGPAKWLRDEGEGAPFQHRSFDDIVSGAPSASSPSSFGSRAWRLRADELGESWLVERVAAGARAERRTEVFELESRRYAVVEAGGELPTIDGRAFCRVAGGER